VGVQSTESVVDYKALITGSGSKAITVIKTSYTMSS